MRGQPLPGVTQRCVLRRVRTDTAYTPASKSINNTGISPTGWKFGVAGGSSSPPMVGGALRGPDDIATSNPAKSPAANGTLYSLVKAEGIAANRNPAVSLLLFIGTDALLIETETQLFGAEALFIGAEAQGAS